MKNFNKVKEGLGTWREEVNAVLFSHMGLMVKIKNTVRGVIIFMMTFFFSATSVFADETSATTTASIWTNVFNAISSIYSNLVLLATIIAATAAVIALLIRMISKNQRAVEEANSWLKRIAISYVLINAIGLMATFLENLLSDTAAPGTTVDQGIQSTPGFN